MSSTMKRLHSVVITIMLVASTNYATSLTARNGVASDMPKPKSGVPISDLTMADMPKP